MLSFPSPIPDWCTPSFSLLDELGAIRYSFGVYSLFASPQKSDYLNISPFPLVAVPNSKKSFSLSVSPLRSPPPPSSLLSAQKLLYVVEPLPLLHTLLLPSSEGVE